VFEAGNGSREEGMIGSPVIFLFRWVVLLVWLWVWWVSGPRFLLIGVIRDPVPGKRPPPGKRVR